MVNIDGKQVEMRWFLLDTSDASYSLLLEVLRVAHESQGPKLSVNVRYNGRQALVKVMGPLPEIREAWKTAILRTYTAADHAEALTLTSSRATLASRDAGWQKPE